MGTEVLLFSLAKTAAEYKAAEDKKASMQTQANEMGALTERMRAQLLKNLHNRYKEHGQQVRGIEEAYGQQRGTLAAKADQAVSSVRAQGGDSGASLTGPGTLQNLQSRQQQSGLQAMANLQRGRQEDLSRQKFEYETGRDTMRSNVNEKIKQIKTEERALRTASTDMLHNAQRMALFNFVSTAATLGTAADVKWFGDGGYFTSKAPKLYSAGPSTVRYPRSTPLAK